MRVAVVAGLGLTAIWLFQGSGPSFSRGAWLGTAMAALVMMMLAGRRMAWTAGIVLVVVVVVLTLGGAQALPDVLAERLASVTDNLTVTSIDDTPITDKNFAVKERTAYWFGGLQMFRDNILTGVGLGNYGPNYDATYYSTPFLKSQVHAHNYYIHIAAETGIFGLLTYLLLIGGVLWTGVDASRRACADGFVRALAIGGVGVIVAIAVHNFFEDLHVLSLGVHLSAVWGLLAAIRAAYPHRPGRTYFLFASLMILKPLHDTSLPPERHHDTGMESHPLPLRAIVVTVVCKEIVKSLWYESVADGASTARYVSCNECESVVWMAGGVTWNISDRHGYMRASTRMISRAPSPGISNSWQLP